MSEIDDRAALDLQIGPEDDEWKPAKLWPAFAGHGRFLFAYHLLIG